MLQTEKRFWPTLDFMSFFPPDYQTYSPVHKYLDKDAIFFFVAILILYTATMDLRVEAFDISLP